MPKMFVHTRQGTFTPEARAQVASALTDLGIACERLPNTAKIRSGVWVFFTEHAPDATFRAGEIAPDPPPISLIALSLEGGFDAASKQRMIADATAILAQARRVKRRSGAGLRGHPRGSGGKLGHVWQAGFARRDARRMTRGSFDVLKGLTSHRSRHRPRCYSGLPDLAISRPSATRGPGRVETGCASTQPLRHTPQVQYRPG